MATTSRANEASCKFSYDVILSFRGEDTRKSFTDHLYTALVQAGIDTFRDDDEIQRGENIDTEIDKAIRGSKMSIIVFSRDYAASRWCLDELVLIMELRETVGHIVFPVFYNMDPSEVSQQTGNFAKAFARHEVEHAGKLEEWREALRKVTDLAGMVLQDRHEAKFIKDIVKEVRNKLNCLMLHVPSNLIGIDSRVEEINLWLQDGQDDVGIGIIVGIGGIGKTTLAKVVFNENYLKFDSCSFLKDVKVTSENPNGLVELQRQLLSDLLKGKENTIHNIDEGTMKIMHACRRKKVLIILDDVDKYEHFDVIIGMRDRLYQGSKIIITTRHLNLPRPHEECKKFMVRPLSTSESLELFSWHAFGHPFSIEDKIDDLKRIVQYCCGLPLALKTLGSCLSYMSIDSWKRVIKNPEAIDDGTIHKILRVSYDSLQSQDKSLFLDIACFFIGKDKDYVDSLIEQEGNDSYRTLGIQELIGRCLITIDDGNKLAMHQLIRDMGREIVRQESENPGERSRLWSNRDAFNVLRNNTGTKKVRSLSLDCQENKAIKNEVEFTTEVFTKMRNLKLLHLNNTRVYGDYQKFPKSLVWLCWRGLSLNCMPDQLFLEYLVILDLRNSCLKHVWRRTMSLPNLKILDLSHSHLLVTTPNFEGLSSLVRLILKDCINLVEIGESIGELGRLVFLDLENCKKLRKLPGKITALKALEELVLSHCSQLELPKELDELKSLRTLHVYGIAINQLHSISIYARLLNLLPDTLRPSSFRSWLSPKTLPSTTTFSFDILPHALVHLDLAYCNISDADIPNDLSILPLLKSLDLSGNQMCTLPESINKLSLLQRLDLVNCKRLQYLPELPKSLQKLYVHDCASLKRIGNVTRNLETSIYDNLPELQRMVKLHPTRQIDIEMINNLQLFDVEALELDMVYSFTDNVTRSPVQGINKYGVFNLFLDGNDEIPYWYDFQNEGSSVCFYVPHNLGEKFIGFNFCAVYSFDKCTFGSPEINSHMFYSPIVKLHNKTKNVIWGYNPVTYGVPSEGMNMLWLGHCKFKDQFKGGDEVYFEMQMYHRGFYVKKVGIHLVYEDATKGYQCVSASPWYQNLNYMYLWGADSALIAGNGVFSPGDFGS